MKANTYLFSKQKTLQKPLCSSTSGFTVVEILVVVIMVGILAAMAGAGFVGWLDRMRVNASREAVWNAITNAQVRARQSHASWQASFKEDTVNGKSVVKWAVHDIKNSNPTWTLIEQTGIKIDSAKTTLPTENSPSGAWKITFDSKGYVINQPNLPTKITLTNSVGGNQRCVIVKTVLGVVKIANDKYCN